DTESAIIARRQVGAAVMHFTREDRAVARFVDATQFLHDRGRQPDLEPGDGATPRRLDVLEMLAHQVRLVEIGRHQRRRQNVDLVTVTKQPGDFLGFLPGFQFALLFRGQRGSRTVATAWAAIPSPRPVKPRRSVVVALTLTRSGEISRIAATLPIICWRCGA